MKTVFNLTTIFKKVVLLFFEWLIFIQKFVKVDDTIILSILYIKKQ